MVIITADDFGADQEGSDRILECWLGKRIGCASAMVFMEDSERSANAALESGLEVGLHLNLTSPLTRIGVPDRIREHHKRVASYLGMHKLCEAICNPILRSSFEYSVRRQYEEFVRIYGRPPAFYNGHHHMHLCANVRALGVLPRGTCVRRTFTFDIAEKNHLKKLYRRRLDRYVMERFVVSDSFFSIEPLSDMKRIAGILERAKTEETVEIEVHPHRKEERDFLLGNAFRSILDSLPVSGFGDLARSLAATKGGHGAAVT
jgi:predicted glycoside hydrolase/deacetylase ChbG (UPF0249 family)